jgi:hypothetical protein
MDWDHFWVSLGRIQHGSRRRRGGTRWIAVGSICGRCHRPVATRKDITRKDILRGYVTGKCSIAATWIERNRTKGPKEKIMEKTAEKFEAVVSSGALVIPQPEEIIERGFSERVRAQVETIMDLDVLEEAKRRLLALERYVNDKARQNEVRAACRWTELRIGQLLGQPEHGGDRKSENFKSSANDLISPNERNQFRELANNPEIVAACLEDGKTSRAAILSEIGKKSWEDTQKESAETTVPLEIQPTTTTPVESTEPMRKIPDVGEMTLACVAYLERAGANFDQMVQVARGIVDHVRTERAVNGSMRLGREIERSKVEAKRLITEAEQAGVSVEKFREDLGVNGARPPK